MSAQVPPPSSPLSKPPAPTAMSMAQNSNPQHAHNVSFMNNSFGANNATAGGPAPAAYSPPKTGFNQAYPPHGQPHAIPATQCLPATTQPIQPAAVPLLQSTDKPQEDKTPQSNGCNTTERKENHVTSPQKNNTSIDKEKHIPVPSEVPQVNEASITSSTASSNITPETPKVITPEKEIKESKEDAEVKDSKSPSKDVISPLKVEKIVDKVAKLEKTPEKPITMLTVTSSPKTEAKTPTKPEPTEHTKIITEKKDVKVDNDKSEDKKNEKNEPSDAQHKIDDKNKSVAESEVKVADSVPQKKDKVQSEEAESTTANLPSTPTTPQKPKEQSTPVKSPIKVATTPRTPQRRSRTPKGEDSPRASVTKANNEPKPSTSKSPGGKTKRSRVRTQPYQSPLPELEIISKISQSSTTPKSNENKLIVFFKNEFLAVRNSDGGFFVCQAVQNVYKRTSRIKIRWLSQDKGEKSNEIYTPDFYDYIDFECILTNLELTKVDKGKFRLPAKEHDRTENILKRAIAVEKGEAIALDDSMTEDNPDGLDVSLYTEEEQLTKRKGSKRKHSKGRKPARKVDDDDEDDVDDAVDDDDEEDEDDDDEPAPKTPKKRGRKSSGSSAPVSEPKRNTAGGRAERAKRRSGNEETKTSPVIDNKKAKVLAKVVKRTIATPIPKESPKTKAKEPKVTKVATPVASTSKAKTPKTTPPPARKTPKRGRK